MLKNVCFKPELFLLGISPEDLDKQLVYLTLHIVTTARIVFAQHWKNEEIPTEEEIIKKILDCAEMDRLTLLRLREEEHSEYFNMWNLFYKWLEDRRRVKLPRRENR